MKLVTVANFRSQAEAALAKNALEENGIHATFSGGQPVAGFQYFDPLGAGVSLAVAKEDLEPAIEILNEAWEQHALRGERKWPEEEQAGDKTYRISTTAFLVMFGILMISAFLTFLFKGR